MYGVKPDCDSERKKVVCFEIKSLIVKMLQELVFSWNKYEIRSYWRTYKAFISQDEIPTELNSLYDSMSESNRENFTRNEFRYFMEM